MPTGVEDSTSYENAGSVRADEGKIQRAEMKRKAGNQVKTTTYRPDKIIVRPDKKSLDLYGEMF